MDLPTGPAAPGGLTLSIQRSLRVRAQHVAREAAGFIITAAADTDGWGAEEVHSLVAMSITVLDTVLTGTEESAIAVLAAEFGSELMLWPDPIDADLVRARVRGGGLVT